MSSLMAAPLDLKIALEPPPAGAPAGTRAAISLRYNRLVCKGDLLADLLSDAERAELGWYLEEYWQWPYDQFAKRGRRVEALLPVIGRRLYDAVCASANAVRVVGPWRLQPLKAGQQRQISIVSDLPAALSLPWELLHDEQGFLALRSAQPVSILRCFNQGEADALESDFVPTMRVLLVTARPDDAGFVDPRSIARELFDELQPQIARIADAVRRIWAGERDWHALAEGIDRNSALRVLRVIEEVSTSADGSDNPSGDGADDASTDRADTP